MPGTAASAAARVPWVAGVGIPSVAIVARCEIGDEVIGSFSPVSTDHPQGYVGTSLFEMTGKIRDAMVFGSYERLSTDQSFPQGTGVFHLKIIRNRSWAEGFCTFFSDDDMIACSFNIWVKENQKNTLKLLEIAERVMSSQKHLLTAPVSIPSW